MPEKILQLGDIIKKLSRDEIILGALAIAFLKSLGEREIEKIKPLEEEPLDSILKLDGEIKDAILKRYQK